MAWTQHRRYLLLKVAAMGVAVICGVAGVGFLLPRGPSETERAIDAKLAELRARGVPLTPLEVAKILPDPDPEHDARNVLAKAIELALRETESTDLPFIGRGTLPKRGEAISNSVMHAMQRYLSEGGVMKAVPECLDGVRFSLKWSSGSTNPAAYPRLLEIRELLLTLAMQALYDAERGNSIHACEALRKGFQFAWVVNDDDVTMGMIRVACAREMCTATEQVLNRINLTATELMELERRIAPERVGDFRNAFVTERAVGLMWFDEARKEYGKRTLQARFQEIAQLLGRRAQPNYRDEDRLLFLNSMEAHERTLSLPVASCLQSNFNIDTGYWNKVKSVAGEECGGRFWRTALITAFETRTRLVVLKSVLAIERYRLSNSGATPTRLDDLVPDYLQVLPVDPFDEQPLKYERRDTGYIVYSIGADGKDDDGKELTDPANKPETYDVTVIVER